MSGEKAKVVAGVVVGMVLGIAVAVGVAWFVLKKNPGAFVGKEPAKPEPAVAQAAPPVVSAPMAMPPLAASGTAAPQHFEFYKVLTDKDKSDAATRKNSTRSVPRTKEGGVAAGQEKYYVQAGSFQNADDAEKLKAKLALSGFEASVQAVNIADKGTWYRVRLGPYTGSEAGRTITALRQDGISATQQHAQ